MYIQCTPIDIDEVNTPLRIQLGVNVRSLRQASGLSQEAFSDKCGFARSYMSRIERGISNPSIDALEILADALEVTVSDLLDKPDSITPKGIFVPFAKDGSCFNPQLKRPNTGEYCVGSKKTPVYTSNFGEALYYLIHADKAQWLRPNHDGKWGAVSGVYWGELPSALYPLLG